MTLRVSQTDCKSELHGFQVSSIPLNIALTVIIRNILIKGVPLYQIRIYWQENKKSQGFYFLFSYIQMPTSKNKHMVITKATVKSFLLSKRGYIKKSPSKVAAAIIKAHTTKPLSKITFEEAAKHLKLIREVQSTLRTATTYMASKEEEDIVDIYNKIIEQKERPKRKLFFDIEVSPDVELSWGIGRKVNLSHDSIIQERAIICICWKWDNEDAVHSLEWKKGDDREMLVKFAKIANSADEIIAQNGDNFDIKWLRTRCLYHRISVSPKFNTIDTLKMARQGFRFNANRLDYMGKFMGFGGKIHTDYDMWKDILLKNDQKAMALMVAYCKEDVVLLEKVYNTLQDYCPVKKFKYKP